MSDDALSKSEVESRITSIPRPQALLCSGVPPGLLQVPGESGSPGGSAYLMACVEGGSRPSGLKSPGAAGMPLPGAGPPLLFESCCSAPSSCLPGRLPGREEAQRGSSLLEKAAEPEALWLPSTRRSPVPPAEYRRGMWRPWTCGLNLPSQAFVFMNPYLSQLTALLVRSVSWQRPVLMGGHQTQFVLPRPATSVECVRCGNPSRQMVSSDLSPLSRDCSAFVLHQQCLATL